MYQVGILTVSDRASQGIYKDESGPILARIIKERSGWQIKEQAIVGDELEEVVSILKNWCAVGLDLILTSGGTGFAERDITPEATLSVVDRLAPGISEAIRAESLKITKHAMLSRGAAGIRERTLVVNLPGSPKAAKESLDVILPILPHALALLAGKEAAEDDHRKV